MHGIDPTTYGQLEAHAGYVACIAGAILVGIVGLLLAAVDAIEKRQERRVQAARADERARQLDAGTRAGWHDPSPADRRRDR